MCNYLRAVGLCPYGFAVCEESAGSFLDCGVGRVFFGFVSGFTQRVLF